MTATPLRSRATAIVETAQGILLAQIEDGRFMPPGGGIETGETPLQAVIRELYEETTLVAESALFLFEHCSPVNQHFVFLIQAHGQARPQSDARSLAYYQPGCHIPVTNGTRTILGQVVALKQAQPALFAAFAHTHQVAPRTLVQK